MTAPHTALSPTCVSCPSYNTHVPPPSPPLGVSAAPSRICQARVSSLILSRPLYEPRPSQAVRCTLRSSRPLCRSAPPVFLAVLAVISRYPGRVYVSVPGPPLCSWLGLSAGAPSIHAGRGAAPTDASTARNPTAMASDSDTEEFFDAPEDVTLTCSPGV